MTTPMKQKERSKIIKEKILDISLNLFILNGYKSTTTREIIKKAGITTGTLYHFFRDKEDILLHIVLTTFSEAMNAAINIIGKENDSALVYATIYALEMKAIEKYDRAAELYLESYSSWRITEVLHPINVERNKAFFHKYNPGFTDEDYYIKTLALRGMRLSFIIERLFAGGIDYEAKCAFLIETGLAFFNVPPKKIKQAVTKALNLTSRNSLTIYGFRI